MSNRNREFNKESKKYANAVKEVKKRSVTSIYPSTSPSRPQVSQSPSLQSETEVVDQKKQKAVPQAKLPEQLKRTKPAIAPKDYQDGPAHDIDKRDSHDLLCATNYVQDMYKYFREEEHRAVVGDYMEDQQHINERMRSILVDWLVEVHQKIKLDTGTLYLTVNIVDRYLVKAEVERRDLQLVGVTALL